MRQQTIRRLCVFGSYDDSALYSRNRKLIDALAACSADVVEVRVERQEGHKSNHGRLSSLGNLGRTAVRQIQSMLSLLRQRERIKGSDVYFVPYPAYLDLLLLQCLLWRRSRSEYRLVIDAFLCLHDTLINDRRMLPANGILARMAYWLERRTLRAADLVFIDTEQQESLLQRTYHLESELLAAVPVGIDESVWRPCRPLPSPGSFQVLFWGTFIPLHGIETIIRAAALLQDTDPDIAIDLVGDGQTADAAARLIGELKITNITWQRELLPAAELREHLEHSHCVLGVFGESEKAGNVIPYKAYQALASNMILVTRSGPAISGLTRGEGVAGLVLVPPGNAEALADALRSVYRTYDSVSPRVETRKLYDRYLSQEKLYDRVAEEVAKL